MKIQTLAKPISIIGLELRTNNDIASREIPLHWEKFMGANLLEQIPNKISSDIYAIYTNFEHQGLNNAGVYSCVLGASVSHLEQIPDGLMTVQLPVSSYEIIPVPHGRPDLVGQVWQQIWQQDTTKRTFLADFEVYKPDGSINIWLGVR